MLVNIGDKFGNLIVLERVERTASHRAVKWKCLCACGVEKDLWQGHLLHRKLFSCGCKTVVGNPNNTSNERQCSDCKIIKSLNSNNFGSSINCKFGYDYKCRSCTSIRHKLFRGTEVQKQRVTKYNISYYEKDSGRAKNLLSNYKRYDKRKKYVTDITEEFLLNIFTMCCYSCGSREKLGLDRIDNSMGHIKTNCLPCCGPCNINRQLFNLSSEKTKIHVGPVMRLLYESVKGDI